MVRKTLVAKNSIVFDTCPIPHGSKFVGAPYQISGDDSNLWYQQIDCPPEVPLPTPIINGVSHVSTNSKS